MEIDFRTTTSPLMMEHCLTKLSNSVENQRSRSASSVRILCTYSKRVLLFLSTPIECTSSYSPPEGGPRRTSLGKPTDGETLRRLCTCTKGATADEQRGVWGATADERQNAHPISSAPARRRRSRRRATTTVLDFSLSWPCRTTPP